MCWGGFAGVDLAEGEVGGPVLSMASQKAKTWLQAAEGIPLSSSAAIAASLEQAKAPRSSRLQGSRALSITRDANDSRTPFRLLPLHHSSSSRLLSGLPLLSPLSPPHLRHPSKPQSPLSSLRVPLSLAIYDLRSTKSPSRELSTIQRMRQRAVSSMIAALHLPGTCVAAQPSGDASQPRRRAQGSNRPSVGGGESLPCQVRQNPGITRGGASEMPHRGPDGGGQRPGRLRAARGNPQGVSGLGLPSRTRRGRDREGMDGFEGRWAAACWAAGEEVQQRMEAFGWALTAPRRLLSAAEPQQPATGALRCPLVILLTPPLLSAGRRTRGRKGLLGRRKPSQAAG